jgi:hypothetical protein
MRFSFFAEAEIDIAVLNFRSLYVPRTELILKFNLVAHGLTGLWVGWLSNSYGRRRNLIDDVVLFIFGSALVVFPEEFNCLLEGRA